MEDKILGHLRPITLTKTKSFPPPLPPPPPQIKLRILCPLKILLRCGDYLFFAWGGGRRGRGGSVFMPELAQSDVSYYIWIWSLLSISVPWRFDVRYEHFVVLDPWHQTKKGDKTHQNLRLSSLRDGFVLPTVMDHISHGRGSQSNR